MDKQEDTNDEVTGKTSGDTSRRDSPAAETHDVWHSSHSDTKPSDIMTQYFERKIEPGLEAEARADTNLPMQAYSLRHRNGVTVLQVVTSDVSYPGWTQFKNTIATRAAGAPEPFMLEFVYGRFRFLAQA